MTKIVGLGILASTLIACGPQYHYVKEVDPSTFARPGCHVLLEPVHAETLLIGDAPEGKYVGDKSADGASSYLTDKVESLNLFQQTLIGFHPGAFAAGPPDNTFVLRVIWKNWEPGFYAAIVNKPGVAEITVDVLTTQGQLLEEWTMKSAFLDFSSGGRMRGAWKRAAGILGVYMNDRWACLK